MAQLSGLIQHVIVLMMENHSFDHMLGWLPGVGELDGTQSNQVNGQSYFVTSGAGYSFSPNPYHDLNNVTMQIFGKGSDAIPTMSGFASNFIEPQEGNAFTYGNPKLLMQCYSPEQVPVISTLAMNYTVCTRWFCSVPGPTGPNRIYGNCASSGGYAGPAYKLEDFPSDMSNMRSIFGVLNVAGLSWGVYHEDNDFAPELILDEVKCKPNCIFNDYGFTAFFNHLKRGMLPNYSFLTPSLWENSQHPPVDIRKGENLIADIYEALVDSQYWRNSLFILTYDEHGGFYDSVATPLDVPNPDGINSKEPKFAFERLGPRVPAILVSPYVQAMVDVRQYEHSSIPATVLKLFDLSWPIINKRLATVNTFHDRIGSNMRNDIPKKLLRPLIPVYDEK